MPFTSVTNMLSRRLPDPAGAVERGETIDLLRSRNALASQEVATSQRVNALARDPNATPDDYSRAGRSDIGNALLNSDRQRREAGMDEQEAISRVGDIAAQALTLDPAARRSVIGQVLNAPAYTPVFQALGADPRSINVDAMDDATLEQQLRRYAAYSRKPADSSPLEQVMGPDGQPMYATRSQAVGKQPYLKPEGAPSSYDEYIRAQKDPTYAAFLRERQRKGMSITTPDGTVIDMGGAAGNIGPDELTAPTRNKLQDAVVMSTDDLDRLNSVGEGFDPQFLTIQGKAWGAGLKLKEISGGLLGSMTPKERQYLRDYTGFRADASRNLTMTLKRLSGAAITPSEGERVAKGLPTADDSPTEFQAKYGSAVKDVTRAIMRANWALKNGIGVKSVDDLSRSMPLSSIDRVYEERANQIWQEMGGSPESKQQAITQAKREFGMAR